MKVTKIKIFVFVFAAVAVAIALRQLFQSEPIISHQAESFHVRVAQAKKMAEEATHHGGESVFTYQAKSTREMAKRLIKMAEENDPETNLTINDKRVIYFRNKKRPPDLWGQIQIDAHLAVELLHSGKSKEAAQQFSRISGLLSQEKYQLLPDLVEAAKESIAFSYLRIGIQENCFFQHNAESCLLPIQGSGIHTIRDGSNEAIKRYTEILNDDPDDLSSRWLLNIAYMTLGEYPEKVPSKWLIPPKVFESDYDIKRFYDAAPQLGIDAIGHAGGSIMEDFDGDGNLDIMASSNGLLDQLRYFKNNGNGSFTERTIEAGLKGIVGGKNICHSDYNNDGYPDVLVLRGGWLNKDGLFPNSLLRNNGDGTFDDVTEEAGLLSFHPAQTASWGDYDHDGWVDLFIGNESYNEEIHACELFHNNGDGTFTDVASEVGLTVVGFVKGVVWGDYNNDGWSDLYISNLLGSNLLFRNDGGNNSGQRIFTEVSEEAGVTKPLKSFPTWFWDYNNDGWLDIFVSGFRGNIGNVAADYLGLPTDAERPRLYRNNHDGTFTDVTKTVGLYKVLLTMGCNFGDLDNDGFLDFYAGTGDPDLRTMAPNRMFRNADGKYYQDVTTSGGFGHLQKGHGVAFGDIDNDGDQDIYAVIGGAFTGDLFQNVLFENPGHGNHWITLKLEGVQSNRAAIGARIKVSVNTENGNRDIYNTVTTGGSFGSSSLQQEIGLGQATSIRAIEITWPTTGKLQVLKNVAMDQVLKVRESDPAPVPIILERFSLSSNTEKDKHIVSF